MADFTSIPLSSAPPRPPRASGIQARKDQYDQYLAGLKKGQAGRLVPGEGESINAVRLRVIQAGKRAKKALQVWQADGSVYFTLV